MTGTKVLVALFNPKFAELADADYCCYSQLYPNATQRAFENAEELLETIRNGFDIVHLFCDVPLNGNVADSRGREVAAVRVIDRCCESNVKLLWVASDNKPEAYIKGFKTGGKPLNLVLTIDRKKSRFTNFLENLLRKMSAGESMPVAWVLLSPQNSNHPRHANAPACIFAVGRGGVRLR